MDKSKKRYRVRVHQVREEIMDVSVDAESPEQAKNLAVEYVKCKKQHVITTLAVVHSCDSQNVQTWD
ncbi:MAG: hypothetical protein WC525_07540 [Candidatus Thermoplasmatota archaeon]